MPEISVRELNDLRAQYQGFHDRLQKLAEELPPNYRKDVPDGFKLIGSLTKVLEPEAADLGPAAVVDVLKVTQATLDVADDLVDDSNAFLLVWIDCKRQTMAAFIDVCSQSCANCGFPNDPSSVSETGVGGLKVADFASDSASKDDKENVTKFLAALDKACKEAASKSNNNK